MMKSKKNYQKKMGQLKYKDLILQMHENKIPVSKITKNINFRLNKTKLKISLSESTIRNLIKKYQKI